MRGFLFPGQGAQYIGMGQKQYRSHAVARAVFEEASDVLGENMEKLIFKGSADLLAMTEWTQPALLTVGIAAYRTILEESDVRPDWMLGHSLGEITALTCASAIRLEDALKIVRFRGQVMQQGIKPEDCLMLAVNGIDADLVLAVCNEDNDQQKLVRAVAAINSSTQVVLSGLKDAVFEWRERLETMGASIIPLKVSAPFHSPLMASAAMQMKEHLAQYTFSQPECKVVSNVTAKAYMSADQIVSLLSQQVTQPVKWRQSLEYIREQGVTELLDLGPGSVMKKLAEQNGSFHTIAMDQDEEWRAWLLDNKFDRGPMLTDAIAIAVQCLRHSISTPNRNWNEEECERGISEPIRYIKDQIDKWEEVNSDAKPRREEIQELLLSVQRVFETKRLTVEEKSRRFNQLLTVSHQMGIRLNQPTWAD